MSTGNDGLIGSGRRKVLDGLGATPLGAAIDRGSRATDIEPESGGKSDDGSAPVRTGPFRRNRFLVEIDGVATVGFARVVLPAVTSAEVKYREGTDRRPTARSLAGLNEYETLLLEKGVSDDSMALYEWFKLVQDKRLEEARRPLAVTLLDAKGEPGPRWEFEDAWPVRYDAPALDALANEVAVERLEITYKGMERTV